MSEVDDFLSSYEPGKKPTAAPPATQKPASEVDSLLQSAPVQDKGFSGHMRDIGLSALKSAIAVPEMAVGLADIPTGGRVGKFLENEGGSFGFRPKEAKEFLSDFHTDQYKDQQRQFQEADGVLDKTAVALQNPSLIGNTVVESLAPMFAGGVIGRGVRAVAPKLAPVAAGAIGEGAVMAGSQAEGIRQQTEDGLMTPPQSGAAVATGVLGAAFGYGGGKLAQKLGIGDIDTMMARGLSPGQVAQDIANAPAKSIPRKVIEGAITEGFLEELPQSVSETIIQNLALDKPWHQGVEDAAVMGTLAGMAMGGGASFYSGMAGRNRPADAPPGADPAAGQPPGAPPVDPRIGAANDEASLRAEMLAQQEAGEPAVPQSAPAEGNALLRAQEEYRQRALAAETAAGRAEMSPEDEINQSIGRAPLPSEQMGLDPNVGPMSAAAALAVDTGASGALAQAAQTVDPETGEITEPGALAAAARPVEQASQTPEQLRERLSYESKQAMLNGGWDQTLVEERERVQAELVKAVSAKPITADEIAKNNPMLQGITAKDLARFGTVIRNDSGITELAVEGGKIIIKGNSARYVGPGADALPKIHPYRGSFNIISAGAHQVDWYDFLKSGKNATARPAAAQATVEQPPPAQAQSAEPAQTDFDVSTRTPEQLQYLAANGQAGWKEAAQVALERRQSTTGATLEPTPPEAQQGEQKEAPQAAASAVAPTQATEPQSAPEAATQAAAPSKWDGMTAELRTAILNQPGGWSTAKGSLNVIGKQIAGRSWADMPEKTRETISALMGRQASVTPAPADQTQQGEKEKWIKAAIDKSRMNGTSGVQLSVTPDGGVTFLGDPNSNKDGKALLATYEKALQAGATPKEIAAALQGSVADAQAQPPTKAPKPSIRDVIAKQIPEMTDAELQQAIAHYGPEHKRTAKLQKEAQRRGQGDAVPEVQAANQVPAQQEPAAESESPAVQDFVDGKRDTAPTVAEVEAEQKAKTLADRGVEASQIAQAVKENAEGDATLLNDLVRISEPEKAATEVKAESAAEQVEVADKQSAAPADRFANNKLFTADKVAAARARMKAKLGRLNSGIDPEMLVDGMTVAGAYIESGIRNFSQYAQTMIEDMGDGIKPYLLSFWEGARNYPGLDTKGMTSAEESRKQFDALLKPEDLKTDAIGEVAEKPKTRTKKTGAKGDMVMTQDWGVESINGYPEPGERREEGSATKDAFLKETRTYLNATADALRTYGFEPHVDGKGKAEKAVSVNESGVDGSGDVSLTMRNAESGQNVYIHIGVGSLRAAVPTTPSGVAIMARVGETEDRYVTRHMNQWLPVDMSANELAQTISRIAEQNKPVRAKQEKVENERSTIRVDGTQALDEVATEAGGGTESGGPVGSDAANSGETGVRGGVGTDATRVPAARGGRSRASGSGAAEARGGRSDGAVGARGRKAAPQAADDARVEIAGELVGKPNIPAQNFAITDELQLGQGGEVKKFNDNLAAIRAIKLIESENRRATPDEQALLARYVGWGGLANAFPDPTSGEFKDKWKDRGEELKSLLTADEYKAARRSTRNAHYTSKVVVSAMWKAVERLGFRGGLVLESSMGTGNFVGLAPQNVPSRFIGVEYDSLTARIAQALYPQATVLHSGFQKVPVADNAFALNIGNPPFGSESLRFQYKPELTGVSIHNQFFRAGMDALRPGGVQAMVVSRFLMDAQDQSSRIALARLARLVAAIRLPDTAFRENARTEVVTDILFFQKMTPEEQAEAAEALDALAAPKEKQPTAEAKRREAAAKAPAWLNTVAIPDPLGGAEMTVNAYFKSNPQNIIGVLERSGSMQHGADITVRLDNPAELSARLDAAIARMPENIHDMGAEIMAATEARFKSMSDALRIAIANEEVGHLKIDADGKLQRVIERETPESGFEFTTQEITENSPWSDQLNMDADGRWYKLEVKMDADGKAVKALNQSGEATKRNVYERVTYQNEAEIPASMRLGKTGFERLTGIVKLRDLLKRQLTLETADAAKAVMEGNRKALASAYEAFVSEHGPLNRATNLRLALTMPDGGLVAALEVGYQPERTAAQAKKSGQEQQQEKATPAPILRERVVPKYEPATGADSPADALAINLAESGRVSIDRVAQLLNVSNEDAIAKLQEGEDPLVFQDPETGQWETADVYMSGMVKRKLNAAKAAGAEVNVKALEKVIPEAWTAENVAVQLGSTWVPASVYADFVAHLTGGNATVSFSALTNSFSVNVTDTKRNQASEWGTSDVSADYIVGRLLNSQPVVVTRTDGEKTYIDKEATALAGLKAREVVAEFGDWIFKDGDRRNNLVELFNEMFNTRVVRQYNGQHLQLPGKVPDSIIKLRRHQLNAIWRGIYERFMLVDHAVGAGKTFTAIARAMERRRMGLSRKPMIVVPNHLVEQWEADVYRLYPGAKVLAAGKKDFEAKRRRRLFGKIATGDWDIVIVPHSSFGFIGISPETESRYLEQEMKEAKEAIDAAWEQVKEDGNDSGRRKPFGVKEAERLAEKIQARMDRMTAGVRDRLLTFEQLGIDDLTVDEAHEFKNLYYSSRQTGVRGMGDKTGSRKANDLYNKVRVLRENPNATVSFLTGTPISNSAVEMFTMLRYLAADSLEEMGLNHFDAFRAQFVEATAAFEPTESGRLKEVVRLGRTWSNMRALMDLYYSVTDAVSLEDIKKWYAEDNGGKAFPVPKVKGGKDRELVAIQPTPAQQVELDAVMSGFDGLEMIEDPFERNSERLRLMDRARKLSLDIRAVDPRSTSKEVGGKLEVASQNIKRIYDQWSAERGTQLVFLDRSVPKAKGDDKILKEFDAIVARRDAALAAQDDSGFQEALDALERFDANEIAELRAAQNAGWNAYQQIKDNLVAMGIPANEIRFVQEAANDEQKAALFDAVNGGKVRVLIGSTPRMGAGTNVQQRAVALHHVDVTWKPSDIEQREGRVIRQGNMFATPPTKNSPNPLFREGFEVEIIAYATERTVDAKMWDLNATKLRTINGIRKYDGSFTMEFEDEEAVGMAEMAALASGNPLLLERVKLESDVGNLELQERAYRRKMYAVEDQLDRAKRAVERNPRLIEQAKDRTAVVSARMADVSKRHDERTVTVDGKSHKSQTAAFAAAFDIVALQQAGNSNARYAVTINGERATSKDAIETAILSALGDVSPFEAEIGGETVYRRNTAVRKITEALNSASTKLNSDTDIPLGSIFGLDLSANISVTQTRQNKAVKNAVLTVSHNGSVVTERGIKEIAGNAEYAPQSVTATMSSVLDALDFFAQGKSEQILEKELQEAQNDLPGLVERSKGSFPKAEEMAAKRKRLAELVRQLSDTTNQTAPQETEAPKTETPAPQAAQLRNPDGTFTRQDPVSDAVSYARAPASSLTPTDKAIYGMAAEGAPASEILTLIAKASRSRFNRQVANLLLKAGINPTISIGDAKTWNMAEGEGSKYAAAYNAKTNTVALFRPANAERHMIHELMHAATIAALEKKGLASVQMKALFAHVKKSGKLKGMYGMTNVQEFVAEVFANPDFQRKLKTVNAPAGSKLRSAWDWLVRILRGALNLPVNQESALSAALETGVALVRENMRAEAAKTGAVGSQDNDGVHYNLADSAQDLARNIGDGLKSITVQDVKKAGRHKLTDWLKLGLQFLGRRQLVDIYGGSLPMADYDRMAAQMEADKNETGAAADDLARRWGKLKDEKQLAELMHDATLAQIDADSDVAYVPGDDPATSAALKKQFKALAPDAQKVYRDARDHYRAHHNEVRNAIIDRISRSELRSTRRAELLKRMDEDFFKSIKGVYFPLARFGQYVVVTKDATGKVSSVSRAETMAEAEAMRKEMVKAFPAADGFQVGRVTLSKEFTASRDMVGRGFMTELYDALDQQNLDPRQLAELEDTLGQLYLSSLPDLSWAKHGIHRKGTPGFSQDARRAFAQNTFHGARYLAKLRYGDQMQLELDKMQKHADQLTAVDGFDQPAAQRVVDEMNKRHEAMMNPKSNPLSSALTSAGFIYYLGLSPAAAIVNMSQTPLVAYPVLGAKWGFKKAGAALMTASKETMEGKNDLRTQLKDADEIRAYDEAVRSGTIDVTMAHDLAGIAQGEDAKVMWKMRPVMRLASVLFHHAERFNRQATFLAAYRLARGAGTAHDTAYEQAVKATYDGHFDYSAGNRARVMQGNVARVVLLFKQYAQNMIFTIGRNAYQSVQGETPEVRREARRVFASLMAMHAAAAGVLGLPFVGSMLAVASALGGSDDEPWDAEIALRNMLADAFGKEASEVIAKGFSRLTPWDVSGRVGLAHLLLPDVQEGLEGQRLAESFTTQMLGPVVGIGVNITKGAQKMAEGDYKRGLEDMLPIALRNPLKAYRFHSEGAQDRTGVEIAGDVSMAGVLGQGVGFSPSEVRLAFEGKSAVMNADRRLNERRQTLMTQFARAMMDKDAEGMTEARERIAAFNSVNPGRRITPPQLMQSVKNRQRRIDQAQDGVFLPRNRRDALEAGAFAAG